MSDFTDSFQARQQMSSFLNGKGGRNVMGVLQEAPLDDPSLRQEIFDDRLSQSGTTYGEHSSTTLARGGQVTHPVKTPLSQRKTPDWNAERLKEINGAIQRKENELKGAKNENERIQAQSSLDALKGDKERIVKMLEDRSTAKEDLASVGGTWAGAKSNASKKPEAMKEARWQRQEFMDACLTETAKTFLENAAKEMGIDPKDISIVELTRDPEKMTPGQMSEYLDGRNRRFQLEISGEVAKTYGNTLTVSFLAPGSTEDTSDIDMQFIVEENPAACSQLIETFQKTAGEQLTNLRLSDKSLAERFDMNPYPAGFVFRPELGSDLHFSDTYTQSSLNQKKTVDGGLALLRRLDSSSNPKAEIESLLDGLEGPQRESMLRSISVGVEVSLKAQMDRAKALQPKLKGTGIDSGKLDEAIKGAGQPEGPKLWKSNPPPSVEQLTKMLNNSQALAKNMEGITKNEQGRKFIAEARNEVYINSLKQVETLTVERDKAVAQLGKLVQRHDDRLNELDKELHSLEQELLRKPGDQGLAQDRAEVLKDRETTLGLRDKALQEMRDQTSEIGVESFTAQGVALHHADEAYTNRGAIGHVVEQQMQRKFVATTGSAISSIEANHGFILEHIQHDHHGHDLSDVQGKELAKIAGSIGKYIERIGQSMETVDYRSVVPTVSGQGKYDRAGKELPKESRGLEIKPAPYQPLAKLGKDLALLKKNIDPTTGNAMANPGEIEENGLTLKENLTLKALESAGIKNLSQLKQNLDNAVKHSWTTQIKSSIQETQSVEISKNPSVKDMLNKARISEFNEMSAKLKHVGTNDRSAPNTKLEPTGEDLKESLEKREGAKVGKVKGGVKGDSGGMTVRERLGMLQKAGINTEVPKQKVGPRV